MTTQTLQHELRKKRPFDRPEEEAYLNILRTAAVLAAPFEELFRRHGLSEASYNVLRILRGHRKAGEDGVPSQSIGPEMVTLVPDVTRLVDRLVEAGLAERGRTDSDRRIVLVRITRKGLDLLSKLDRPTADTGRSMLGHMSRGELATLSRLLVKARRPEGGERLRRTDPRPGRPPVAHRPNSC